MGKNDNGNNDRTELVFVVEWSGKRWTAVQILPVTSRLRTLPAG